MKARNRIYALAGILLLILIVHLLNVQIDWAQLANRSGPAEWLSALLNLVMAGAAVAAFITARSWLPQLTTQEGYRLAIDLVNNEFIWMGINNPLQSAASNVCIAAEDSFTEGSGKAEENVLTDTIVRLKSAVELSKTRKETISMAMFRMQTYGLQVANDRQASMNAMLRHHTACLDIASTLLNTVSKYHSERQELKREPLSWTQREAEIFQRKLADGDRAALDQLRKLNPEMGPSWQKMVNSHTEFTGGDHRIGKLFIVRKG